MRYIVYFVFMTLFLSCKNISDKETSYRGMIQTPKNDWVYYTEEKVLFSTDLHCEDCVWFSNIDGFLGYGFQCAAKLSSGKHCITLQDKSGLPVDSVYINIQEKKAGEKQNRTYLLHDFPYTIQFNSYAEQFFIYSTDGTAEHLKITAENTGRSVAVHNVANSVSESNVKRDVQIPPINLMKKDVVPPCRSAAVQNESDMKKKEFFVMNTASSICDAHRMTAALYYKSDAVKIWITEKTEFSSELIDKCIYNLENVVIPRLNTLWGECEDINGDGSISVLFSPTINSEGVALGFFNPDDFFKNDAEIESSAYNPYSNEMDIFYVALPQSDNYESDIYSVSGITATLAHEMTHAINFTNKTWRKIKKGDSFVQQEETFLEEGLSHLSESLCGFGISGGNMRFINYYLSHTPYYPLVKSDVYGQNDTAGQRGGMALFLYWLFCKKGGFYWADENPIALIDGGGIAFLRRIVSSDMYGTDAISDAYGRHFDLLFMEFCNELLSKTPHELFDCGSTDPATNERILCPAEVSSYPIDSVFTIIPYSFAKYQISKESSLFLTCSKNKGSVYAGY